MIRTTKCARVFFDSCSVKICEISASVVWNILFVPKKGAIFWESSVSNSKPNLYLFCDVDCFDWKTKATQKVHTQQPQLSCSGKVIKHVLQELSMGIYCWPEATPQNATTILILANVLEVLFVSRFALKMAIEVCLSEWHLPSKPLSDYHTAPPFIHSGAQFLVWFIAKPWHNLQCIIKSSLVMAQYECGG